VDDEQGQCRADCKTEGDNGEIGYGKLDHDKPLKARVTVVIRGFGRRGFSCGSRQGYGSAICALQQ
ncbi:hypothetical protein ABTD92_21665, partial [Acinetobacter baumannii]